jgi:LmbE family N-acetylglucosaminyl deacetylase
MNNLLLVPHQDDEMLGAYSIMKLMGETIRVATVFRGGGEPRPNPYPSDVLHEMRCSETSKACNKLGVQLFDFLRIDRGTNKKVVARHIERYLDHISPKTIFTAYPCDNHPEHILLGNIIKDLGVKAYGFIIQTDYLMDMRNRQIPDISIYLTEGEYYEKIRLIDIYKTQKHFLPNIVRRIPYRVETFWRIDK